MEQLITHTRVSLVSVEQPQDLQDAINTELDRLEKIQQINGMPVLDLSITNITTQHMPLFTTEVDASEITRSIQNGSQYIAQILYTYDQEA